MWWHFATPGLLRMVGSSLIGSIVINCLVELPMKYDIASYPILFDVHIPVSLKVLTREDFSSSNDEMIPDMPFPSFLLFVSNKEEGWRIFPENIVNTFPSELARGGGPCPGRENGNKITCSTSCTFHSFPGMKPSLSFPFGLSVLIHRNLRSRWTDAPVHLKGICHLSRGSKNDVPIHRST